MEVIVLQYHLMQSFRGDHNSKWKEGGHPNPFNDIFCRYGYDNDFKNQHLLSINAVDIIEDTTKCST